MERLKIQEITIEKAVITQEAVEVPGPETIKYVPEYH